MIRLLVYAIILIAIIFVATEIIKFLSAINGTSSQYHKDKKDFVSILKEYVLVEWPWAELNVLSIDFKLDHSKKLLNSIYQGVYTSVFGENLAAVIAKRYGERHYILIQTAETLYDLRIEHREKSTLAINDAEPEEIIIEKDYIKIREGDDALLLQRSFGKAELIYQSKTVLRTNELTSENKSLERLVSIIPDEIKEDDYHLVKFLLLFYLIWQELTE